MYRVYKSVLTLKVSRDQVERLIQSSSERDQLLITSSTHTDRQTDRQTNIFFLGPRHLFRVGLAGGQQSGAKQQRPGSPYSRCAETDCMMKMLDSAAFYTETGNSPAVFLVYF